MSKNVSGLGGRLVVALAALLGGIAGAAAAEPKAPRPHVVFFMADDLGYADCGFSGGRQLKTPHLDKLAAAGTVLTSFYVQPVCSPTRAALMTGRYPMRLGLQVGVIRPWAKYGLDLGERTLADALREAGYKTAVVGKWHLGSFDKAYWPNARGFDHAYGHLFGAIDYFTHVRDNQRDWYRNGEPVDEPGYSTHLLAREAVRLVDEHKPDQPLFLYVPFNAVHTPLQVPDAYLAAYPGLKGDRRKVAGMLAALDEAVGQIVAAIDRKGMTAQTLFVFSSDNGGYAPGRATDNGPLRAGKGTLYEGGVRAAAFATWPGHIPAGKRLDEPLHMVDWYPTLTKLAGGSLEQPRPVDGRDLWPTLTASAPSPHEVLLLNANPAEGALRAGTWKLKLTFAAKAGKGKNRDAAPAVELFDLAADLGETTNLAAAKPEVVTRLRATYDELAAQAIPPKNANEGDRPR